MAPRQVFISYAHKDEHWAERVRTSLRPLGREADIRMWSDKDIAPSETWHSKVQTALSDADAVILLISPNLLASDYVSSDELPRILAESERRGLKVFPVFVSSAYLKGSPLLKFQGVNGPDEPLDLLEEPQQNRLLMRLAEGVDAALSISAGELTEEWFAEFRSSFVDVEGGQVKLGDSGSLHAQLHALPVHAANIGSFRLARFVVTQSEWEAVRGTQPWLNQQNVRYGSRIPAVHVSWYDAMDLVTALNRADNVYRYRLPTEDEWEYAARGGRQSPGLQTLFHFGDDPQQLINYGWHDMNASRRGDDYAHEVGQLEPNELGLYDMHGNIWEWMADDLGGARAVRGGGFNYSAEGAASAYRLEQKPEVAGEALGVRLVQEPR